MCVGRRINEDGSSDLKETQDPDSKEFLKKIKASGIGNVDVPFYKIPGKERKGNNSTNNQKR